jgi:hypothetical protein
VGHLVDLLVLEVVLEVLLVPTVFEVVVDLEEQDLEEQVEQVDKVVGTQRFLQEVVQVEEEVEVPVVLDL